MSDVVDITGSSPEVGRAIEQPDANGLPPRNSSVRKGPIVAAVRALLKEIDANTIEVFENLLDHAHISLEVPGRPQGTYALDDRRVEGWLCDYLWDEKGEVPSSAE